MGHNYRHLKFSCRESVGRIVLARPDHLNSLTEIMHEDFRAALDFLESKRDLRGLLITGTGRGFCAGQDLNERPMLPEGQARDLSVGLKQNYEPLILRIKALPVPVICFVNGVAAGAGVSLALACDLVYAVRSARFIQAFTRIGLLPDAGATHALPRLVGPQRAMGAALFAEPVSAETAEQWGLIWRCLPDGELDATMEAVHTRLAHGPTRAYAATKQALQAAMENTLAEQLGLEASLQKSLGLSSDYREGVRAFAEKRQPRFSGS
ncbi:enoyl-CoA hydratase-related protein [Castellaniella sp. WN]